MFFFFKVKTTNVHHNWYGECSRYRIVFNKAGENGNVKCITKCNLHVACASSWIFIKAILG